jgi:hypothetical protein
MEVVVFVVEKGFPPTTVSLYVRPVFEAFKLKLASGMVFPMIASDRAS